MDSLSGKGSSGVGFFDAKHAVQGLMAGYNPLGFNPLTPPGYSGLLIPPPGGTTTTTAGPGQQLRQATTPNRTAVYSSTTNLTPTHTPPMDVTPPKSPKEGTETPIKGLDGGHPGDQGAPSDCEESYDGSEDEEGIRKPKVNSHGQVKKFKCKQCDFIAVTKLSFWEHTRTHIKPEKMLTCPKCPFVTEYKHHLEYHLRNHQRSKPFQCPKCSYSCVNKSMLNSHMKSHSNVFQYRCADCNYATKYCHSLKLHLRKYSHKPDVVLNLDGTPNPLPIIDVYGTRRGPKAKPQKLSGAEQKQKQEQSEKRDGSQQSGASGQQTPVTPTPQPASHGSPGGTGAGGMPFTPLGANGGHGAAGSNGLMRNLLPHQLFPNPLANMFKNAANAANLPLFPYLNLNFQMFADQQQQHQQQQQQQQAVAAAAAMAQLSPNFPQNLIGQLGYDKLVSLHNNNNNNSGSEDNDLSLKTTISSSSNGSTLGEELLKQITAAAADSSASALKKPGSGSPYDQQQQTQDSEPETSTESNGGLTVSASLFDEYGREPCSIVSRDPQTPSTSGSKTGERSRRKGRAFKLERLQAHGDEPLELSNRMDTRYALAEDDEDDAVMAPMESVQSKEVTQKEPSSSSTVQQRASAEKRSLECKYCDIAFRDDVLYTIHMGYHGYDDVFKCNMCGEKSEDRIGFFLHIARKAH
uniref:Protein hunchback n=1 Tax=Anopheles albimanus TaxID=7167 RepID=A0A182FVX2_ANOAL